MIILLLRYGVLIREFESIIFVSFANVSKLVNQLVTKINKDNITAYKTINS